jgi:hypothetical protein
MQGRGKGSGAQVDAPLAGIYDFRARPGAVLIRLKKPGVPGEIDAGDVECSHQALGDLTPCELLGMLAA